MSDRILIIEGEQDTQQKLALALVEAEYEAMGVANYYEALWVLGEFQPHMVILNARLPLMNGWEACYYLRRNFGIPVIVMGNDTGVEVWTMVLEAGADFYLSSPISYLVLAARIKTVLRRYKKCAVTHQN